jgi:hypothetical protein
MGWLSWRSPLLPVWLWHMLTTEDPADWPWWGAEG